MSQSLLPPELANILSPEQLATATQTFALVGFTGEIGAGKDEAGKALAALGFARFAFGDTLKNMLELGLGTPYKNLHGTQAEKAQPIDWLDGKVTARHMLQTLGTEWGRDRIHPDLWVLALKRNLIQYTANGRGLAAVTDVRFENEAAMIRKLGGVIIHIRRAKARKPWWKRIFTRTHRSEIPPKFRPGDYLVQNDGTVEDLHRAVLAIVRQPLTNQGAKSG